MFASSVQVDKACAHVNKVFLLHVRGTFRLLDLLESYLPIHGLCRLKSTLLCPHSPLVLLHRDSSSMTVAVSMKCSFICVDFHGLQV